MTQRILCGRVDTGCGDAVNWPMDDILKEVAQCFGHLEKGTPNVTLDRAHTLRPDFKLSKSVAIEERAPRT
jgi:hypothetical protein